MDTLLNEKIQYNLKLDDSVVDVNALLNKQISIVFKGRINCIICDKKIKKAYNQGFCYNCLKIAPQADESIIRPELSKAHLGIARDLNWAKEHDLIPHYVYLALTDEVKVGVTRHHQIPTRWIDQGASSAIIIAETPNRHIAGVIEVWLKRYYADKTNWRAMLANIVATHVDLLDEKNRAIQLLPTELQKYEYTTPEIVDLNYPVNEYPKKVTTLSLDKTPTITGVLKGIRGQYLYFEDDRVLNIRKHSGYYIELTVD